VSHKCNYNYWDHFFCDHIWYDIFVKCNWIDTRWQWYSTHLYTNNTQNNTINNKTVRITNKITQTKNMEEWWPCPVIASFTLAFALQLREKHGKTSVKVAKEIHGTNSHRWHYKIFETNFWTPVRLRDRLCVSSWGQCKNSHSRQFISLLSVYLVTE
jgi:hypothetical protein